jgi:hypothetical protein
LSQTSQPPQIQRLLPCREASRGQAEKGLMPRDFTLHPISRGLSRGVGGRAVSRDIIGRGLSE